MAFSTSPITTLAFFLASFSLFVPRAELASILIGLDDVIALIYFFYFVATRLGSARILKTDIPVIPLLLFVGLFLIIGTLQAHAVLETYHFPSELWQFLKRALFFAFAAEVLVRANLNTQIKLFRVLLASAVAYLAFGPIQYYIGDELISLYARTEWQEQLALRIESRRLYGITGHSISWGGFCFSALMTVFISLHLRDVVRNTLARNSLIFFCFSLFFFNAIFSGSRATLLAATVGLVAFGCLRLLDLKTMVLLRGLSGLVALILSGFAVTIIWPDQVDFIFFRLSVLGESGGAGRIDQITQGLGLLDNAADYAIGVSNIVQRTFGVAHGIEVEPVNLLVNYGLLGVFMIYSSCLFVAASLYRTVRPLSTEAFSAAVSSMIFYLIFSLGYFFFQELIVGTYFWLTMGALYGAHAKRQTLLYPNSRPMKAANT